MDTYHAEAVVNREGQIVLTLPFKSGEKVDVVVMAHDESAEARSDKEWKEFGLKKFMEGYDDEDSVYDAL